MSFSSKNINNEDIVTDPVDNLEIITEDLTVNGDSTFNGNVNLTGSLLTDSIDTTSATTLSIGPSIATKVKIGDAGISTEIEGFLETDYVNTIGSDFLRIGTLSPTLGVYLGQAGQFVTSFGTFTAGYILNADIDGTGTFRLGKSICADIEIADTGVPTTIKGALTVDEALVANGNITCDELDTITASPLYLGRATATGIVLGAPDITTLIKGDIVVIGESVSETTVQDNLNVSGDLKIDEILDTTGASTLSVGTSNTTSLVLSQAGTNIQCNGLIKANALIETNEIDTINPTSLLIGLTNSSDIVISQPGNNVLTRGPLICNEFIESDEIDTQTATTLSIGKSTATRLELGDTGITTEIQGPLICTEDIQTNEIDTETATTLLIGKSTATKVEIADSGITTEIQGDLDILGQNITHSNIGDIIHWLKADTNNANEDDHPHMILSQDGQTVWSTIGYDDGSFNDLVIRAGSNNGAIGQILFYTRGDSSGTLTDVSQTLGTGYNLMSLVDTTVTVNGDLKTESVIDTTNTAILKIGGTTASKVEIADTGITTEVKGPLTVDDIDTITATTLLIGKSTATKLELADTGITTQIQGPLEASEDITTDDIDTITATTLLIGKSTATKLELADTSVTTEVKGDLDVLGAFTQSGTGDVVHWIKADTDNSNENDHPHLLMTQDGGLVWSMIGYDNNSSSNDLIIRAGETAGSNGDIQFYTRGNSSGAVTDVSQTLNTGNNIMSLVNTTVTINGDLDVTGNIDNGTWTPTIGDGSNNFTGVSSTGEYRKIGDQYFCNARISWTGKGSASGTIRLSLPVAANNDRIMGYLGYINGITFSNQLIVTGDSGDSYIVLRDLNSGGTPSSRTDSDYNTAGELQYYCNFFN